MGVCFITESSRKPDQVRHCFGSLDLEDPFSLDLPGYLNTCFIVGNEDDILFTELYIGCRIGVDQKVVNVDCFERNPVADQSDFAELDHRRGKGH